MWRATTKASAPGARGTAAFACVAPSEAPEGGGRRVVFGEGVFANAWGEDARGEGEQDGDSAQRSSSSSASGSVTGALQAKCSQT